MSENITLRLDKRVNNKVNKSKKKKIKKRVRSMTSLTNALNIIEDSLDKKQKYFYFLELK